MACLFSSSMSLQFSVLFFRMCVCACVFGIRVKTLLIDISHTRRNIQQFLEGTKQQRSESNALAVGSKAQNGLAASGEMDATVVRREVAVAPASAAAQPSNPVPTPTPVQQQQQPATPSSSQLTPTPAPVRELPQLLLASAASPPAGAASATSALNHVNSAAAAAPLKSQVCFCLCSHPVSSC